MNRITPGLPVHHQLPESTETHVHQIGDAIQPAHPLSSPSPPVGFCFVFWFFGHEAYGILPPRPGIESASPAVEAKP